MSRARTFPERTFGVLLHPSSLPGPAPIGTIGRPAHVVVDWLAEAGAGIWQILPLTMNGKDDSPYFSRSAFAGNPWLVDLAHLVEHGLLDDADGDVVDAVGGLGALGDRIDFDAVRARKWPLLRAAADRLCSDPDHPWHAAFAEFRDGGDWVGGTCHYFALRDLHRAPWWEWPSPIRLRDPEAVASSRRDLAAAIDTWAAVLFLFEQQWREVRATCRRRGLRLLGDIPIYVAPDSADVWLHRHLFTVGEDGVLETQAGVPPDYFSATGQLWRNPLYRWDVMAVGGYSWWLSRLRRSLELSDIVRIDHFRALAAYWEVPGDAEDASGGRWVPGPGQRFVDAVRAEFPAMPFVAEDLGDLDDDVHALRDDNDLLGMRILQFGFDGLPDNPHRPDSVVANSIVYTGTHDNDTVVGWWTELDVERRRLVADTFGIDVHADDEEVAWAVIEAAMGTRAVAAIVAVQDALHLPSTARMNVPSTTSGNWNWRMADGVLDDALAERLRRVAVRHGRVAPEQPIT